WVLCHGLTLRSGFFRCPGGAGACVCFRWFVLLRLTRRFLLSLFEACEGKIVSEKAGVPRNKGVLPAGVGSLLSGVAAEWRAAGWRPLASPWRVLAFAALGGARSERGGARQRRQRDGDGPTEEAARRRQQRGTNPFGAHRGSPGASRAKRRDPTRTPPIIGGRPVSFGRGEGRSSRKAKDEPGPRPRRRGRAESERFALISGARNE
ncbi:hypothetical protein TCSYLVIO_010407, partial [Trypanosoma cruzi]